MCEALRFTSRGSDAGFCTDHCISSAIKTKKIAMWRKISKHFACSFMPIMQLLLDLSVHNGLVNFECQFPEVATIMIVQTEWTP